MPGVSTALVEQVNTECSYLAKLVVVTSPAFWGLIADIPRPFILETVERHCAALARYEELTFKFGLHHSLIATGCVRRPEIRGLWCTGFGDEWKKERNIMAPRDMS